MLYSKYHFEKSVSFTENQVASNHEVVLVEHLVFYEGGTEMKTVSKTFELQTLKLPQLPLGLPLQGFMLQGQIQGMFNGLGFMCQAAFGDFEGKTGA